MTLRYYEDMGLIESIRSDDYAYRLYDEASLLYDLKKIAPGVLSAIF